MAFKYLTDRVIRPSWTGGVDATSRKISRSFLYGADGVVVQNPQKFFSNLNHHPVCAIKGSFAIFFLLAQPPLLARRGDRGSLRWGALAFSSCSFFRFPLQRNSSRRPSA